MARSTEEIKKRLTADWIANPEVIVAYGLDPQKTFEEQFSKASWESIMFHTIANEMNTVEALLDAHKEEVVSVVQSILPHRPKWYRDKVLNFMKDKMLPVDSALKVVSDVYNTTGMSDAEIEAAKVIKYCTADEESGSSVLVIKIATLVGGQLSPVDDDTYSQVLAYVNEIDDAGVEFTIVNNLGDDYYAELDIYFNPILLITDVESATLKAIETYITGLSFNGEYSNMGMVDSVQKASGVVIAEFKNAKTSNAYINGKIIPSAGYFTYVKDNIKLNMKPHGSNQ